ncbi:unnamed protein product, partial [Staurois parvus]
MEGIGTPESHDMEGIGTPESHDWEGRANTFGNIVYIQSRHLSCDCIIWAHM